MYKIKFNTNKFESKNRRDWERQLMNDFAVGINNKDFKCETEKELFHTLTFIDGSFLNSSKYGDFPYDKFRQDEYYIHLSSEKYGDRKVEAKTYGIAQGYIDIQKVIDKVKEEGSTQICFSDFYDSRQFSCNFFKKCFLEISKC